VAIPPKSMALRPSWISPCSMLVNVYQLTISRPISRCPNPTSNTPSLSFCNRQAARSEMGKPQQEKNRQHSGTYTNEILVKDFDFESVSLGIFDGECHGLAPPRIKVSLPTKPTKPTKPNQPNHSLASKRFVWRVELTARSIESLNRLPIRP
jgi:hypothetical protein